MKKVFTIILISLVALYILGLVVPINPNEQRPGTHLSGTLIETPNPDWSFMHEKQKIYLETKTWYLIPHSVTTISFVVNDQLYIPCGWCAKKRWPKNVVADPNVVVKVDENLYKRVAVLIPDETERRRILNIADGDPTPNFDLYRMDPPNT